MNFSIAYKQLGVFKKERNQLAFYDAQRDESFNG